MKETLDIKFLSTLMVDVSVVSSLDKEVVEEDFSDKLFYEIYSSVISFLLKDQPPTYTDLKFKYKDDTLLLDFISKIQKEEPVSNLQDVYDELLKQSQVTKLKTLSENIAKDCKTKKSIEIIANIEADLLRITANSGVRLISVADTESGVTKEISDRAKKFRKTGTKFVEIPSGFYELDSFTLGLHRGNSWCLGAATSDGKTQMAVQMCNAVVNDGQKVLYFLLEDDNKNLIYRFLSLKTGVPIQNILCGSCTDPQLVKLRKAFDVLKQQNCLFVDDTLNDINAIINKVKFAKLKHPDLALIVIDYIGLASDRGGRFTNREQEISSISKKIIAMSKSCNVASLVLTQLNTSPEDRNKGMPIRLNDIRDSKTPTHDAAITTFIHYPFKYKADSDGRYSKEYAQIILAKNRYGETNKIIELTNKAQICKFVEGRPAKYKEI